MTPNDLQAWRKRLGLSREAAAAALALSPSGFLNQLYGHRPVSAQTARLAELTEKMLTNGENSH